MDGKGGDGERGNGKTDCITPQVAMSTSGASIRYTTENENTTAFFHDSGLSLYPIYMNKRSKV
jgi:hypothetical protein